MFTTWDKALVPFIVAMAGVLVYTGVFTEEQAAGFSAAVVPAVVVAIQAVLTWLTPNKS